MTNTTKKTTLYRAFNNRGELLYVGISDHFLTRLHQHQSSSKWLRLAEKVTLEHFATRQQAEESEVLAIHNEKPLFNKKDNEDWHNSSRHLLNILRYEDLHHKTVVDAHTKIVEALKSFEHGASDIATYCYAFQSAIQLVYADEAEELDIPCVSCEKLYYHELMEEKSIEFAVADSTGYRSGAWGSNDIWEATVRAVVK